MIKLLIFLLQFTQVIGFQSFHVKPLSKIRMSAAPQDFKNKLPGRFYVAGSSFYVDPLGISKSASKDSIRLWREAELMHGRVSMMAFLHVLTTECLKFNPILPGVDGMAITHLSETPLPLLGSLGTIIGALEFYRAEKGWLEPTKPEDLWKLRDCYEPGDLGFDPLKLSKYEPIKNQYVEQELNNGRLASLAMAGGVAQELVTNNPVF